MTGQLVVARLVAGGHGGGAAASRCGSVGVGGSDHQPSGSSWAEPSTARTPGAGRAEGHGGDAHDPPQARPEHAGRPSAPSRRRAGSRCPASGRAPRGPEGRRPRPPAPRAPRPPRYHALPQPASRVRRPRHVDVLGNTPGPLGVRSSVRRPPVSRVGGYPPPRRPSGRRGSARGRAPGEEARGTVGPEARWSPPSRRSPGADARGVPARTWSSEPPSPAVPRGMATPVFALGCFWGAPRVFLAETEGLYTTAAGCAGASPRPDLHAVCSGSRPRRGGPGGARPA